jgi:hypothetical protein
MEAKEKALELYNKYEQLGRDFTRGVSMKEFAKLCALKAVDEILDLKHIVTLRRNMHEMELEYWQEVKQEINNL